MSKLWLIFIALLFVGIFILLVMRGNTIVESPEGQFDANVSLTPALQDGMRTNTTFVPTLNNSQVLADGFYLINEPKGVDIPEYDIFYDEPSGSLSVALFAEPLAEVRMNAEISIRSSLGLSDSELCELGVFVYTNQYVRPEISGINLGFSFCPGAIEL